MNKKQGNEILGILSPESCNIDVKQRRANSLFTTLHEFLEEYNELYGKWLNQLLSLKKSYIVRIEEIDTLVNLLEKYSKIRDYHTTTSQEMFECVLKQALKSYPGEVSKDERGIKYVRIKERISEDE